MSNKIIHAIVAVLVFAIPVVLNSHAPFLDITVSSVLNAFYLYLSQLINPTAPVIK